jgi:hypothetical protein
MKFFLLSLLSFILVLVMLLLFIFLIELHGSNRVSVDGDRLPFSFSLAPGLTFETRISQLPSMLSVPTTISLSNNLVVVTSSSRDANGQPQVIDVLFNSNDWEIENTFFVRFERGGMIPGPFDLGIVGIGPHSPVVESAQSVIVFDNELVFGESDDFFLNSCVNNIASQIPFLNDTRSESYIQGSFSDGGEVVEIALGTSSTLLTVSERIWQNVRHILGQSGAVRQYGLGTRQYKFSSCQRESIVGFLPTISLRLYNATNPVAVVSVYPEDYIEFDPAAAECRLKLEFANGEYYSFNPLLLGNMNLRITRSDIMMCDSNF